MCPAFLMPDELRVTVGRGGDGGQQRTDSAASNGVAGVLTSIVYQQKDTTGYVLLQASGGGEGTGGSNSSGTGGTAAAADTGGPMTAAGFYQCVRGQNGARNAVITTDNLTFLLGGNGGYFPTSTITGYYGYTATGAGGYSQLSPIPLAIPNSTDENIVKQGLNSFGCGGNGGGGTGGPGPYTNGGRGGDGLAIIVTW
jgi:hypothetical protein